MTRFGEALRDDISGGDAQHQVIMLKLANDLRLRPAELVNVPIEGTTGLAGTFQSSIDLVIHRTTFELYDDIDISNTITSKVEQASKKSKPPDPVETSLGPS